MLYTRSESKLLVINQANQDQSLSSGIEEQEHPEQEQFGTLLDSCGAASLEDNINRYGGKSEIFMDAFL